VVGNMLEAFKMERDDMKTQLQAEREKDRSDRESFRADLFSIFDHAANANDRVINASTTETNVLPPRAPPPHFPTAPPPSTNPQFTVNVNATQPIWKAELRTFSGLPRDVQTHLSICELAFKAEPNPLDDVQKILVSLNQCVEGPAARWYVTCINSLSSGVWSVKTWDDYKVAFMNTFGDPFITAEGNRLLSSAVQRKDETTAHFLMRFDGYRSMAGQMDTMFDPAMIGMLRERLPPKVIAKVGDHVVSYDKFKAMVIKHDCKIRECERSNKHYENLRALDAGTISGTHTLYAPASDVLDNNHLYSVASTTVDPPVH
jgi:hypothetical protein